VEKRLETLLIDGPTLHRFSAIKHFATEYSNDELLSFLQQNAQLLQGYWVPKSRLLYPKGGPESLARNYVLVLFNKRLKVIPADVTIKKGELDTRVKHFLMQFAFETKDLKGVSYWKFKEVPDESFIKEFPNVVKQQEEIFKILDKEVSSEVEKHKPSKSVVRKGGVKNALVR
jgi:DNA-directed RNA polymerase-3 subunit RPC5